MDDTPMPMTVPTTPSGESTPDNKQKGLLPKLLIWMVAIIVVGGVSAALWVYSHQQAAAKATTTTIMPIQVNITPSGFVPATVSVRVGQTVTWLNYDTNEHDVAADPYPKDNSVVGFRSKPLEQNQSYSFVFDKKGTITYHDDLNLLTFKGTIIVK